MFLKWLTVGCERVMSGITKVFCDYGPVQEFPIEGGSMIFENTWQGPGLMPYEMEPQFHLKPAGDIPLIIPKGFRHALLMGWASTLLLAWESWHVDRARVKYRISNELLHHDCADGFMCYYRALQSTLEIYPCFLFYIIIGGMEMPHFTAIAGAIWIFGRWFHAGDYYLGNFVLRYNGSMYIAGHAMLMWAAWRYTWKRIVL